MRFQTGRPAAFLFMLLSLSAPVAVARARHKSHRPAHHARPAARRTAPKRLQRSSVASRHWADATRSLADVVRLAPKAILVSKSGRTLTLLENGQPVKTYPVAIGKQVTGAKETAGDWRTPEGLYYVAGHNPASRFYKALRISYPGIPDAERGLRDGLISPAQADAIRSANERGALPPQNTRLGYDVEIHGGYHLAATPAGAPARIRSYTRGCVALTNPMIDEIYRWAPNGTPILIQP